jgi:hypothetical protein
MSLKRLVLAVLVTVTISPTNTSAAQEKNELAGMIGRTFISNQSIKGATFFNHEVRFGNGLTFEGNYARHVIDGDVFGISLEIPVVVNWDEDLNTGANLIPESFRSFFVTPAARLNLFPHTGFSPWVSVGGGYGHFNESSTLLFGGPNPGKTESSTGVFQAGIGLDVRLSDRFRLRGEARDFWSGEPQLNVDTGKTRQHNIFVAGGIVWHF